MVVGQTLSSVRHEDLYKSAFTEFDDDGELSRLLSNVDCHDSAELLSYCRGGRRD